MSGVGNAVGACGITGNGLASGHFHKFQQIRGTVSDQQTIDYCSTKQSTAAINSQPLGINEKYQRRRTKMPDIKNGLLSTPPPSTFCYFPPVNLPPPPLHLSLLPLLMAHRNTSGIGRNHRTGSSQTVGMHSSLSPQHSDSSQLQHGSSQSRPRSPSPFIDSQTATQMERDIEEMRGIITKHIVGRNRADSADSAKRPSK